MNTLETSPNWRNAPGSVWVGRAMSGFVILFLLGASVTPKFFMPEVTVPTMTQLGWPTKFTLLIGVLELAGTLLYSFRRTALLGAVVLTGILGGAIATQLRIENPLFSHILFGVYLGLMMWGGLWLRDGTLRKFFPFRDPAV